MGTYGISKEEMITELADTLDSLEGDFTQEALFEVLKTMKKYTYVCDKVINDGFWKNMLRNMEEN